jgi:hypothetical protein
VPDLAVTACDDDRRILALLDTVALAASQQHCEGYDG